MKIKFIAIVFFICSVYLSFSFVYGYPPLYLHKQKPLSPMLEMISLSFGLRRVASGMLFINLLQYYGTPEIDEHAHFHNHNDGHGHNQRHYKLEHEFGAGNYPLFYEYSRKIIFMDPYFSNAALYSCGALAFNLNRPEQAISLLKTVISYSPNLDYYKMLAAIAVKNSGKRKELAQLMYEIAINKDTPVLLKNSAAFINKINGRPDRAREIYRLIIDTTKDESYIKIAKKNLESQ